MELIRLRDSSGKIFDTAMKLYEKSFPNKIGKLFYVLKIRRTITFYIRTRRLRP